MGFFGGIAGALFIRINNRINIIRKKFLNTKMKKIYEALGVISLTVTVMFFAAYIKYATASDPDNNSNICMPYNN